MNMNIRQAAFSITKKVPIIFLMLSIILKLVYIESSISSFTNIIHVTKINIDLENIGLAIKVMLIFVLTCELIIVYSYYFYTINRYKILYTSFLLLSSVIIMILYFMYDYSGDCGCFGKIIHFHPLVHVLINILLVAIINYNIIATTKKY